MLDENYLQYYPLDLHVPNKKGLQDHIGSNQTVTWSSQNVTVEEKKILWLSYGPSNQALCILDDSAEYNIPLKDTTDGAKKFSAFSWLKHFCSENSEDTVLQSQWFVITCSPKTSMSEQQIAVMFTREDTCQYSFPVSNGIWYFLGIARNNQDVKFRVNGKKVRQITTKCDQALPSATTSLRLASAVCVDEFYTSSSADFLEYKKIFSTLNGQSHMSDWFGMFYIIESHLSITYIR